MLDKESLDEDKKIKIPHYFALSDFYSNIFPSFKEKKTITVEDAICDLPKLFPLKVTKKINGKNNKLFVLIIPCTTAGTSQFSLRKYSTTRAT